MVALVGLESTLFTMIPISCPVYLRSQYTYDLISDQLSLQLGLASCNIRSCCLPSVTAIRPLCKGTRTILISAYLA